MRAPHPESELIVPYVLEDLETAERRGFEAHARQCAACSSEAEQLRGILAVDRTSRNGSAPSHPLLGILARQAQLQQRRRALPWMLLRPVPALVAASLAVVLFAAGHANGRRQLASHPTQVSTSQRSTRSRAPLPPPPAPHLQTAVAPDGDLALGRWDARTWRAASIDSATPDSL